MQLLLFSDGQSAHTATQERGRRGEKRQENGKNGNEVQTYIYMIKINEPQLPWLRTAIYHTGLDVKMEVTQCAGRVSANTRHHHTCTCTNVHVHVQVHVHARVYGRRKEKFFSSF